MNNYYIIPASEAEPYKKQILYAWHWGIQAIQIENGDYVIREDIIKKAGLRFPIKIVTISDKEVSIKTEIKKYPLAEKGDIVFKTYNTEQEIVKGK